jgi:hypothetical protein
MNQFSGNFKLPKTETTFKSILPFNINVTFVVLQIDEHSPCGPRGRKNVGTKPGSIIPGGKSVNRILKLKSGTITEIP